MVPLSAREIDLEQTSQHFLDNADKALANSAQAQRRDALGLFAPLLRTSAVEKFENFEPAKTHLKAIRQHTLDHLDYYLGKFESEAVNNGNRVHFARTGTELNSVVLDICQQHNAQRVIKGKSMVTEETGLNEYLLSGGLQVTETDLGEYIIQQAGETPSHIVGPALHKSADEVRQLFLDKHDLGQRELASTADMVGEARNVLRPKFLQGEVGIIGANALIAENGSSMLVTNEGNGDLCANLPRVLIVCTTIDRVLPRAQDATAMLRLLVRSATGQAQTSYTSFYSGPRREGETDGPLETHYVLLDNQRSELLASDYREMLDCIRCGACLTHCPIYNAVGGHAYGWVYQGPMGSVLTPLLTSLEQSAALPNACTNCGRCAEVCPAEIPLPDMLRDLRQEENEAGLVPARWRAGMKLHGLVARAPALYQFLSRMGIAIMHRLGHKKGAFRKLPAAAGWTDNRDFPAPERATFMSQYKAQLKAQVKARRKDNND
ncbi:MAG: L-lactate dehydrogenase complex protein LldF [Bacteroidia bacterium]|jgi:L-lactate dehydrogenase complex protein LldF